MVGLGLLVAAGCGARGGGPQEAGPARLGSPCPVPLVWSAADPRPLGIRIRNDQDRPIVVFLDECRGHKRVGEVAAGSQRIFRLRPPLVAFGTGLRLHVFPDAGLDGYFMAAVAVDTAKVLELRIPERSPPACESRVYVDGERFDGALREIGLERIADMRVEYTRPADGGSGPSCPVVRIRTREAKPAPTRAAPSGPGAGGW